MFSYLIKRGASIGLQVNWGGGVGGVEANFIHFFSKFRAEILEMKRSKSYYKSCILCKILRLQANEKQLEV